MKRAPINPSPLVIVGASLAGLRAAESARREGFEGELILIGNEPHLPYDRPPLSKEFLSGDGSPDHFRTEEELKNELKIDVRLNSSATALDPESHTVTVNGASIGYGRLIIATGADPRFPSHFAGLTGVEVLRTLDQAQRIRAAITATSKVVVVGAGFIGSEIASAARSVGASVVIVEGAPIPLVRAVGETVGQSLSELHERNGTRLLCGVQLEKILGDDHVTGVRLSSGAVLDADLVVVGVGAAPATSWLRSSGIELHPVDGGVVCDENLQTSIPGVFAAGDVAHWQNNLLDSFMRLENWTSAADQGTQVAINAVFPERARAHETVPYFWSDWYGNRIQFVGTAISDSVSFISGSPNEDKFVAAYRLDERLVGVATLNEPRKIMKYRRLIANRASWQDALTLYPAPVESES